MTGTPSLVFDSFISSQRSFPSRVRSPTPANTEIPPCLVAILLISSWMMTVFPTPAPPNKPIFPPFKYGSIRSITLIPVSNISRFVFWSTSAGAGLWMGSRRFASIGPNLSTGSPITLMTRPKVDLPTGIDTGPPVSSADIPRTIPSVGCNATHRTRPSPRCCWTSTMTSIGSGTLKPLLVICNAW